MARIRNDEVGRGWRGRRAQAEGLSASRSKWTVRAGREGFGLQAEPRPAPVWASPASGTRGDQRLRALNQSLVLGLGHRLHLRVHIELAVQISDVRLHGGKRHTHAAGSFVVTPPAREQLQQLEFLAGEA